MSCIAIVKVGSLIPSARNASDTLNSDPTFPVTFVFGGDSATMLLQVLSVVGCGPDCIWTNQGASGEISIRGSHAEHRSLAAWAVSLAAIARGYFLDFAMGRPGLLEQRERSGSAQTLVLMSEGEAIMAGLMSADSI